MRSMKSNNRYHFWEIPECSLDKFLNIINLDLFSTYSDCFIAMVTSSTTATYARSYHIPTMVIRAILMYCMTVASYVLIIYVCLSPRVHNKNKVDIFPSPLTETFQLFYQHRSVFS